MPLLGLAALIAAVSVAAVRHGRAPASARPAAAGVLGAQATPTTARLRPKVLRPQRSTTNSSPTPVVGSRSAQHSVRVLAVVGPEIFWIGKNASHRTLVHLQGPGTRWRIRPGQRLTFTAVVARNRPVVAARWGLTRREGRDRFGRQASHFEVYGPRIRFLSR